MQLLPADDHDLVAADGNGELVRSQQCFEGVLAEPDPDSGRQVSVNIALLAELFGSLSRLCHKINNPLTSIMGRAQILRLQAPSDRDEKLYRSIKVIEESSGRVAALVQELASLICQGRKEFVEYYDSKTGSR